MRIFVTGTGRCGTVTFARACECVEGFTVAHESHANRTDLEFPDDHIEVDAHLFWIVPGILERYPAAWWVILHREREALVRSIATRNSMSAWAALAFQRHGKDDPMALAERFVDFVNGALEAMLPQAIHLTTPISGEDWARFLRCIGATASPKALDILQTIHNASVMP